MKHPHSSSAADWRMPLPQQPFLLMTLLATVLAVGSLTVGLTSAPVGASHRYHQSGCSFVLPMPVVSGGTASFTFVVRCSTREPSRKLEIYLMADDPSYDDALAWATVDISAPGTYPIRRTGWRCQEDAGDDEIYLRARVDGGSWVSAPSVSADCVRGSARSSHGAVARNRDSRAVN